MMLFIMSLVFSIRKTTIVLELFFWRAYKAARTYYRFYLSFVLMYMSSTNWCASIPFTGVKPVKISAQNRYNKNQSGFVKLAVVYLCQTT